MPPEVPARLKAFHQFGFVQEGATSSGQAYGSCPFCHKGGHFYIDLAQWQWDCKKCQTKGNFPSFFTQIVKHCQQRITQQQLMYAWQNRGIKPVTLKTWGLGHSGHSYTIPVISAAGTVINVKRWSGGKVLSTAGSRQGLGFIPGEELQQTIWVTEGEWDAMALWEGLRFSGCSDTVCFAPGAGILPNTSLATFTQRDVIVAFDNDKAGWEGAARYSEQLHGVARSLRFVHWPEDKSEGYDIRDFWRENRVKQFHGLLQTMLQKESPRFASTAVAAKGVAAQEKPKWDGKGITHIEAAQRFQKWLKMVSSEPLDIMFGTMLANRLDGDPLWMFIVAPPGGMKSELLLTLGGLLEVVEMTSLTPQSLISGFNIQGGDPSLIPRLNGKVLVIKDFTTILTMNSVARDEIFGILRDAYDGRCEKPFGNGVIRRYESKFGVLAGVTPAIEQISSTSSVLGERFVRYRLQSTERAMSGRSKILRALHNLRTNSEMRAELKDTAEAVLNWDHTSLGYPNITDDMLGRIAGLAQWTGTLRGVVGREKYTGMLTHKPMAEVGTRLAKQLCKLAYGISLYRRETEVSEHTYQTLTRVAQGTAPDRVEEVVRQMYIHTKEFGDKFSVEDVSALSTFPKDTVRFLLQDMGLLRMVNSTRGSYYLSSSVYSLMDELKLYEKEKAWLQQHPGKTSQKPKRVRRSK